MWERLRRRVTFANTLAVVALFVALGGTSTTAAIGSVGDCNPVAGTQAAVSSANGHAFYAVFN